jgi:hypothetical protein
MQHRLGTSSSLVDAANAAPRQLQAWLLPLVLLMVMVAVMSCLLLICMSICFYF